jgi:tRNA pseudouridine55 synthase
VNQPPSPPPIRSSSSIEAAKAIDGILNVSKPVGITSMDVVRRIKRAGKQKRVGHGGTLDPFATGVIPVCMGQATRMMEYLIEGGKEYRGVVELGVETDTYDSTGETTAQAGIGGVTQDQVAAALASFTGVIEQVPPMYSALKRQGRRLYTLARAGIEVERQPRKVAVFRAVLEAWSPPSATIYVDCSRGLYMRSLAHDLGQKLGCGGHLKSLMRLRSGPFRIEDAVTLEDAERAFASSSWTPLLHPPDTVLSQLRAVIVNRRLEERLRQGQALPAGMPMAPSAPEEQVRVYSPDGRFLAILAFDAASRQWQPVKVFDIGHIDSVLVRG